MQTGNYSWEKTWESAVQTQWNRESGHNCKRVVLSLVKGNELQCTVHFIHSFRDKAQAMRKSGDEKVCWRCEIKENV